MFLYSFYYDIQNNSISYYYILYAKCNVVVEFIIKAPNVINIKINGSNTKNQANPVAPPRHITFKNQVQNKTYNT